MCWESVLNQLAWRPGPRPGQWPQGPPTPGPEFRAPAPGSWPWPPGFRPGLGRPGPRPRAPAPVARPRPGGCGLAWVPWPQLGRWARPRGCILPHRVCIILHRSYYTNYVITSGSIWFQRKGRGRSNGPLELHLLVRNTCFYLHLFGPKGPRFVAGLGLLFLPGPRLGPSLSRCPSSHPSLSPSLGSSLSSRPGPSPSSIRAQA